jgi:putative oxidoreductase
LRALIPKGTATSHAARSAAREQGLVITQPYDVGLLLMRIVLGLTFVAHGTGILFGWFEGAGIAGFGALLASMGYPAATALAVIAGLCETLGGLGLLLGLFTPLAAAVLTGTMINATGVIWRGFTAEGFFGPGGVQLPVILGLMAAGIALTGPGAYALDRYIPGFRRHRLSYGVAAIVLGVVVGVLTLLVRS